MLRLLTTAVAILFLGALPIRAQGNMVQITQQSIDNNSLVDQSGAVGGEVSIDQIGEANIADVADDGSNSFLVIEQRGAEQNALVRLSGSGNQGDIVQDGAGNSADLIVSGTVNNFSVNQSAMPAMAAHDGNVVILSQTGLGNVSFQTQVGSDNRMTLRQNGLDNFADLLQQGQSNLMELEQNGNENSAALKQFGKNASPIMVTQNGGMSVEITQRGE